LKNTEYRRKISRKARSSYFYSSLEEFLPLLGVRDMARHSKGSNTSRLKKLQGLIHVFLRGTRPKENQKKM
jgi:hypothetical protein